VRARVCLCACVCELVLMLSGKEEPIVFEICHVGINKILKNQLMLSYISLF
jgi:hypothetical protein